MSRFDDMGKSAEADAPAAEEPHIGVLDKANTVEHGVLQMVPGGEFLARKLGTAAAHALHLPIDDSPASQAEAKATYEANPGSELVGNAIGAAAMGKAMPEGGNAAESALQAGMLAPAYKLGETANQADLQHRKIDAEMIEHSFNFKDILEAAGIGAVFHVGGHMAGKAMTAAGDVAKGFAEESAGKLFPKSAAKLKRAPTDIGEQALQEGWLKRSDKAAELAEDAGKRMEQEAAKAELDPVFFQQAEKRLGPILQAAEKSPEASEAAAEVQKYAKRFAKAGAGELQYSGQEFQTLISDLRGKARATKNTSQKAVFNDVAAQLRDHMATHLEAQDPGAGARYRDAVSDYRIYASVEKEAAKGAEKVLRSSDVAKTLGRNAILPAAGSVLGPAGTAAGFAMDLMGAQSTWNTLKKNKALFWDAISKIPPSVRQSKMVGAVIDTLMSGTKHTLLRENSIGLDEGPPDETYDKLVGGIQTSMADPNKMASGLSDHLDHLEPVQTAAVTSNIVNKLQTVAVEAPQNHGPMTAFGVGTSVSQREKRDYLRKVEAKFDPYNAVASGRRDMIQEAEKHNPETVNAIKQEVIRRMQTDPKMSYSTKRRLAGILGLPGVPMQDPALAGHLQQAIKTRREAKSAAGQAGSARQMNASLKN